MVAYKIAKTYSYNGKQISQEQMDQVAQKASPDQREAINKQFWTAYARAEPSFSWDANNPVVSNSSVASNSSADNSSSDFKTWYDAYIKANQDVYNITTDRQNQQFKNTKTDLDIQMERNRQAYALFTSREIADTWRQLALNDTNFSRSLSNATSAYGQRGLIRSWIQDSATKEWTGQFWESQTYFKTQSQRRLQDAQNTIGQKTEDYNKSLSRLDTERTQYAQDRAAGSQVMVAWLKSQGNVLYGQSQVQNMQLAQQQAEQDVLDKLYGRTSVKRNLIPNIYL